ncbi:AAA family ATPase [Marinactinospora rubrisoli]|uniref:AAA family ATPase n=1 Tax=Marinactinospora rubrisoli TaxID=2715399 RepID=A0ABW2KN57_9ACTN
MHTRQERDYRLAQECGATPSAADVALNYRLDGSVRGIERLGAGWAEFGHEAGTVLEGPAQVQEVREVMSGRDPHTGVQLVKPKKAVHPAAKLTARPLSEAVERAAAAEQVSPENLLGGGKWAKRFAQLQRGLHRDGDAHRAPVRDLEAIAAQAGVDPAELYEPDELATAREHADERVTIGIPAWRIDFDFPKSEAIGQVDEATAARIAEIHMEAVRRAMAALESWCAYGMSGHHGDGQRAERVETTGWAATATHHRSARGTGDGTPGDPHDHVHVMIPNMVRCADGKWRTVAAGGRDLMRHVPAVGQLARAISRQLMTAEFGVAYERNPATGRWEIVGFGAEVRALYSRRAAQVDAEVGPDASPDERRRAARRTAAPKRAWTPEQERASWRERAAAAGIDIVGLVQQVLGGPGPAGAAARRGPDVPDRPDPDAVADMVWDPESGVTAHTTVTTRARVMAAVADACPAGLSDGAELEELTAHVLADPRAVVLPESGQVHMANAARYTSADVVAAERSITSAAAEGIGSDRVVVAEPVAGRVLAEAEHRRGFALSAEQRAVVERLLSAEFGVDAVIGRPGTGKTTIMSVARQGWEAAGYRVAGAATAAVAAANLSAQARIPSQTVAAWVRRIEAGRGLDGVDVLVIDEAAMVDARSAAVIIEAAQHSGTKIVSIGDPAQLKAVGAGGGWFKRVHQIVSGLTLTENRRQRHDVDRAALAVWHDGARRSALAMWAQHGRVHAPETVEEAHAAMVAAWWQDRAPIADVHEAIADVLMLAATNHDVEEINRIARATARRADHLSSLDVEFATAGGERLELAVGEVVRLRRNDYRSRNSSDPDVLNGYRGVVLSVDRRRGALVEWRHPQRGMERAWIAPDAIARGDLTHGYAMTIASAQGLTCERVHAYGVGADAHSLYPALSRARERADLYLPALDVESWETRARLGEARSDEERLARAVAAYAATLTDVDDGMVTDEIDGAPKFSTASEALGMAVDQAERPWEGVGSAVTDERQSMAAEPEWTPLTMEQARAGQGPHARRLPRQLADFKQQADEHAANIREVRGEIDQLREELRNLDSSWRSRRRRRQIEDDIAYKTRVLKRQQDDLFEVGELARRLRDEAIQADVRQAEADQARARQVRVEQVAGERGITVEQAAQLPDAELDPALERALQALPGGMPAPSTSSPQTHDQPPRPSSTEAPRPRARP